METKNRIKNVKSYNLDNIDNSIVQINLNEYNYNHCSNLVSILKNNIDQIGLIKYASLNSENQLNLLNKISSYLNINYHQILLTNSTDISINNILKLYATKKSKVIIFIPTYNQYENLSNIITDKIIKIKLDRNKLGNQDSQLESYNLSDSFNNNRIICFLCNPNNPTGYEWSEKELKRMFRKYPNIIFIIDETYIDFSTLLSTNETKIYSCTNCVTEFKNIIILRTFSKAFGLAGLRIGYLVSNELNINTLSKVSSHRDIIELSKLAASIVLDNILFYREQINLLFNDKQKIINLCIQSNIKYIDTKCNFLLIYSGNFTKELKNIFLENNIVVKDLSDKYLNLLDGYIRINICVDITYITICILDKYKEKILIHF